jgi:hypothetical protein
LLAVGSPFAFLALAVVPAPFAFFVAARLGAGFLARSSVVAFPAPRGSFGITPSLERPSGGFALGDRGYAGAAGAHDERVRPQDADQGIHHGRAELRAGVSAELVNGLIERHGRPV